MDDIARHTSRAIQASSPHTLSLAFSLCLSLLSLSVHLSLCLALTLCLPVYLKDADPYPLKQWAGKRSCYQCMLVLPSYLPTTALFSSNSKAWNPDTLIESGLFRAVHLDHSHSPLTPLAVAGEMRVLQSEHHKVYNCEVYITIEVYTIGAFPTCIP